MNRSLRLLLALAVFCATPAAVLAVDGVIEINQAAAQAGGITPGDAPGFPVTLSQEGSYRLTGNLDVRGETTPKDVTAIEVSSGAVSIDLNGFEIVGPVTCTGDPPDNELSCTPTGMGVGVLGKGNSTVTVRNGTIKGMGDFGIDLLDGSRVESVRVLNNGDKGIRVRSSSIVKDCIAMRNAAGGIEIGDGAVASGNSAVENGATGINANVSSTVSGNTATGNRGIGIAASQHCLITGNVASGNNLFGLFVGLGVGYSNNVFNTNGSGAVSGGVQLPPNVCGGDTTCP